eukprot:COSAG06_NODE_7326_length_2545_cov_9.379349_3_plen_83_part_00
MPERDVSVLHSLFWLTCSGSLPVSREERVGEQYLNVSVSAHAQRHPKLHCCGTLAAAAARLQPWPAAAAARAPKAAHSGGSA